MTVEELLSRISSYELTEWIAYERATGPLLSEYQDDVLAAIHEQLQALRYLTGALHAEDNPVPEPKKLPRPSELCDEPDEDEDDGMELAEFSATQFD